MKCILFLGQKLLSCPPSWKPMLAPSSANIAGALQGPSNVSPPRQAIAPRQRRLAPVKVIVEAVSKATKPGFTKFDPFAEGQGQWYDAGTERTCEMLEKIGYKILDPDVETIPRDPIIHFVKP